MTAERWQRVRELLYAASAQSPAERQHFLHHNCGEDEQLRAEVERLLAASDQASTFLEPGAPAETACEPELNGGRIGPYLILELAGRGGMGSVFRAVREDDYHQQVALKLVRREVETAFLLDRFRQERQVLAMLNHPNIARLLDGGTTADQRPYLVMEWVEGAPITTYCRERDLPVRARVALFVQVCQAVAHAHANLVVHRDLKPSNILITGDGAPKLLDFGIAKILSPDRGAEALTWTLSAARALTPDYASPEQVRGEPVSTATDIYSLGAVLYDLLAGSPPHRFETRTAPEIERVVCTQEVRAPSQVAGARELRGDLDNIVLKALAKDRARRYSHVEELAADLRRYLEGRPVLARADSLWYRGSKFARRNKALTVASAAAVLAIAGGLGVALWQARVAHQQRAAAERRFDLARRVADSLLYEVNDSISELAGSTQARELLLRRSLEYFDALSRESSSNTDLERDLANAYSRAATLQGTPGNSNLGNPEAAGESLKKAAGLLTNALAAQPQSVPLRRDLAKVHRQFVAVGGDPPEQLKHAQAALDLVEQLRRERPEDASLRDDLEKSEYTMGRSLSNAARQADAIAFYRRALTHSASSLPDNVALTHKSLGALLIRANALDEALQQYRSATVLDEARVQANPANGRAQLDLSFDYSDSGLILLRLKRPAEAVEQYRKSARIRTAMVAADPRDVRAANALVSAHWRLGWALAVTGDRQAAAASFREAVQAGEKTLASLPDKKPGTQALAEAYWNIGLSYRQHWSSCPQAVPYLVRAQGLYRELGQPSPLVDRSLQECGTVLSR